MIGKCITAAGIALFVLPMLAACNGSSQDLAPPPPPNAMESMDNLPGGIGPTDEEPDDPPSPE
jgi:hypothetical protein